MLYFHERFIISQSKTFSRVYILRSFVPFFSKKLYSVQCIISHSLNIAIKCYANIYGITYFTRIASNLLITYDIN